VREIRKNMTNCQYCKRPFEAQKATAKYCSGKCRAEDSRKRRDEGIATALKEIERGVAKIRGAVWGEQNAD